jgi:hypothetical protein
MRILQQRTTLDNVRPGDMVNAYVTDDVAA